MTTIIRNLGISGYRSFGAKVQVFDKFSKVNLLIGRNNSGKSNVIRFLSEVYPRTREEPVFRIEPLMYHSPGKPEMRIGIGEEVFEDESGAARLRPELPFLTALKEEHIRSQAARVFATIFQEKRRIDGTNLCWSFQSLPERQDKSLVWRQALKKLDDRTVRTLWSSLTNQSGGDRQVNWEPEILQRILRPISPASVVVIPAIRQIGAKGSTPSTFDGAGIIDRLARLQNPDVYSQKDRERFLEVTEFLRNVLDSPEAAIEIPYERDTILVHMDNKVLPIESLGSGIHEIVILAAAATTLSQTVLCIEEPELHLNPILQRKLIRYLSQNTNNQYFISTHSPALMDTAGVEIYHIKLEGGQSVVERVTSDNQRSTVCEDLGYHPSDLLQANSVIWVEGPSDRTYINFWLKHADSTLVEGVHYSIMFYGGRLAAHLSNEDYTTDVNEFISLRRLNRRGVLVLDSDREKKGAKINATKMRLQKEFDTGPGHTWVTEGREIENYIAPLQLRTAIETAVPSASLLSPMGRYDSCLRIKSHAGKETQAPKVDVARRITTNYSPDFSILDLKFQINKLVAFIRDSNPAKAPANGD